MSHYNLFQASIYLQPHSNFETIDSLDPLHIFFFFLEATLNDSNLFFQFTFQKFIFQCSVVMQ